MMTPGRVVIGGFSGLEDIIARGALRMDLFTLFTESSLVSS
jgi:hypothetical protein